jgi:tripartite-type tricarboxylate transporter receptor subunit TctC
MMDLVRKSLVAVAFAFVLSGVAEAQTYPDRPVRILVGFAAGSGPDVLARTIATQLSTDLGQQFFIENRPGANGTVALRSLVQAEADGYTLLYASSSITPIPYIYKDLPFDILRDLAPIATAGILDGYLMLVNPALPVRNVPEFIAYAKNNRVLYGSPGVGNNLHLAAETFNVRAGLKMEHVPFKGSSEVQTNLMAGHIQVMFVSPPGAMPLVREGNLRAIGYAGSKPFPDLPELPLISATVTGFPVIGSWGMF